MNTATAAWLRTLIALSGMMLLAFQCNPPGPGPAAPVKQPCNGAPFTCLLTKKGFPQNAADYAAAGNAYYAAIDPNSSRDTFTKFKQANGFGGPDEVRATYFNDGDLYLGRDMHCVRTTTPVNRGACYVTNYGPPPFFNGAPNPAWPNPAVALADAIAAAKGQQPSQPPFATVAMEWTPFSSVQSAISVPQTSTGDTLRTVRLGDVVRFEATGQVRHGHFGPTTGPEGQGSVDNTPGYPLPGSCMLGLIVRAGGPWQCIAHVEGSSAEYVHRGGFAPLEIRINDYNPGDGAGEFTVKVTHQAANNVNFYVYAGETRSPVAALDKEGDKPIPQMCMACHGGDNSTSPTSIQGASFLPFDLASFKYDTDPAFARAGQEEAFRKLNAMVHSTSPNPRNPHDPIREWINGMYSNNVNVPNTVARNDWVPQGWNAQPGPYLNFVAPYCRSCHVAVRQDIFDLTRHAEFKYFSLLRKDVCNARIMPHAQVPFEKLWATPVAVLVLDDPNVLAPPGPGELLCRDEP